MALFFGGAALILALLYGAHAVWAKRMRADIAESGALEWERLTASDAALLEGVDRMRFDAIYMHTHFPRFPGYALAATACFIAALPVVFAALSGAIYGAGAFGLLPEPVALADRFLVEEGRMKALPETPPEAAYYWMQSLGGFYYFFGVVFAWMAIAFAFVRRYHRTRPGYLRDEILRARSG